ncbi:General amino acid permease [Venturia nashicola]|nr:General amino acid permease [Venturia nashicola]
MSPAPQQVDSVVFDTSILLAPTASPASQDLAGPPGSAAATSTSESTSSPSSTSIGKTASPLDAQAHGSGKSIAIAIAIAIAIVALVIISTVLLFCSRKRKQAAKQAQYSEARLLRRSQLEDAPPPYLPSREHDCHNSIPKDDLPATPTRPQSMVVNEKPASRSRPALRSMNSEPPLPLPFQSATAPTLRSDTQPSMPMTHLTEGSWATLPTMSTQPTLPKANIPGRLAPLPNENVPSRFST